jgi:16S rRNA (guanine527-N7)-methyltransferase
VPSAIAESVHVALVESQRLGFLGERPIDEVIEHARAFVGALDEVTGTVVDLGAGGGIPGLVIAHDRPDLHLTLVDRRRKRTDFLERVVRRLRWSGRVAVIAADVEAVIATDSTFDAAVARGFGPPDTTLRAAARLVRPAGRIVISEPPSGDRWDQETFAELGICRIETPDTRVVRFDRDGFT